MQKMSQMTIIIPKTTNSNSIHIICNSFGSSDTVPDKNFIDIKDMLTNVRKNKHNQGVS